MISPVFPRDLEREIFETAALLYPKKIPTLLLVAHRVLVWIEPFIYRVIDTSKDPSDAIWHALQTKPASFFADNVRHLHLSVPHVDSTTGWTIERTDALLEVCPRITSFFLCGLSRWPAYAVPSILEVERMSELRRFGGHLEDLIGMATIDPGRPIFRSVTHMDILDFMSLPESERRICKSLTALPALTHLCLDGNVPVHAVQRLLQDCPHLQALVNIFNSRHFANQRMCGQVADVRFAVLIVNRDFDMALPPSFWPHVDSFIARKRRGEIKGITRPRVCFGSSLKRSSRIMLSAALAVRVQVFKILLRSSDRWICFTGVHRAPDSSSSTYMSRLSSPLSILRPQA
ncbi:hypothetical protein GGX14DRAFT_514921 [Mycena pura]|uniref:Uncharacterized protein n=1 Tax=Mycena pura TaxID=153505 RepID=A0AAD6VSE4_9AGAR|nr:hypothetical protein GGX14DRAFT_514921 [Mycena pura]